MSEDRTNFCRECVRLADRVAALEAALGQAEEIITLLLSETWREPCCYRKCERECDSCQVWGALWAKARLFGKERGLPRKRIRVEVAP